MKPREDPKDKAARLRERRMSELEQRRSAEETAAGLTTDLNAVYGMGGLNRMAGVSGGMSLFAARGARSGSVAGDLAKHYGTPPR